MDGMLTRGQPTARAAIRAMIDGRTPHALLLVGPPSVGKTTLALDLAAGLLCLAREPAERPCRDCRGCRLVASGNHPDIHRLRPGGAGNQIKISASVADPRPGVRELVSELSLMAVEGGARLAIVEGAHRMNEDAQNALLKALEEPPPGVVIVLAADDEDRLLPTIRSRCSRVRLGTVSARDIEAWLSEKGAADPPTSARLARLAGGRPGLALAYARAPVATAARAELDRSLLDLLVARTAARLAAAKHLLAAAGALGAALAEASEVGFGSAGEATLQSPGRRPRPGRTQKSRPGPSRQDAEDEEATVPDEGGSARKASPADRRRAAMLLIDVWRDQALDIARAELGEVRSLHDPGLLEETVAAAGGLTPGAMGAFLGRLDRAARALEGNASPELAFDVLVLAWPQAVPLA